MPPPLTDHSSYDANADGSVDTHDMLLIYNYIQAN